MSPELYHFEDAPEGKYNLLALRADAPFTQGFQYGEWQKGMGQNVFRRNILKNAEIIGCFQAVSYPLISGKKYLYIPHGPVLKEKVGEDFAKALKQELAKMCASENAAFARFDSYPKENFSAEVLKKSFSISPLDSYYSAIFQSKYDWVLDISKTEGEILSAMHEKTRYSVRLSVKKEIKVEQISGLAMNDYFEKFYELMVETATRGKFALHPKQYYKIIFDSAAMSRTVLDTKESEIVLFVAKFQGEILATHLVIFYGTTAFYPFGASTEKERNRQPTYALHFEAIKEAKKRGCTSYNFGAIEEAGSGISHENWSGISDFKRKFGGTLLEYSNFYDHVANPLFYHAYNLRKKLKKLF